MDKLAPGREGMDSAGQPLQPSGGTGRSSAGAAWPCDSKAEVASLSEATIQSMSRDDLLRAIAASRLPMIASQDVMSHLERANRGALAHAVRAARLACRRQGY